MRRQLFTAACLGNNCAYDLVTLEVVAREAARGNHSIGICGAVLVEGLVKWDEKSHPRAGFTEDLVTARYKGTDEEYAVGTGTSSAKLRLS